MVEVIVREKVKEEKDGTEVWRNKKILSEYFSLSDNIQVGYNNFGHLIVRLWHNEEKSKDIVIVFDKAETYELSQFVRYELR
ncbi:hypothetical protein E3E22_10520 [Thermococcus sp. MV5]|uniref:hypothetical protein n=1 Tax=unclassified Thermococcus TaxID=2627626 RepID=UPI0014304379|nr:MULTISPECIES: hypothetical protein [unclassified Thermococcus]NJE27034.1 hypothetical protein [Thermococcus sp. MV5]NJE77487.1 hypothetical protein [Thermococcus sp. ES12]